MGVATNINQGHALLNFLFFYILGKGLKNSVTIFV